MDPGPIGSETGRILAIDLGEKRIGIAVSDPTRSLAKAVATLRRRSRREDFARINGLIETHKTVLVVMGLPITLAGGDSPTTAWVRHYSAELAENIPIPLVFWDESYSTIQAAESLTQRGVTGRKQKEQLDSVAAAFILQNYLDAGRQG